MSLPRALLDLYWCGARFQKKIAKEKFGLPLVMVTIRIVGGYSTPSKDAERTLEECLIELINNIEYSKRNLLLPFLHSWTMVNWGDHYDDEIEYVAKSLIATVKKYRLQTSVLDTRLVIGQGLEWAINAMERSVFSEGSIARARQEIPYLEESSK